MCVCVSENRADAVEVMYISRPSEKTSCGIRETVGFLLMQYHVCLLKLPVNCVTELLNESSLKISLKR